MTDLLEFCRVRKTVNIFNTSHQKSATICDIIKQTFKYTYLIQNVNNLPSVIAISKFEVWTINNKFTTAHCTVVAFLTSNSVFSDTIVDGYECEILTHEYA